MTKQEFDTYDYIGRKGTKNSPDGKHTAIFTEIGEWAMGADMFKLTIDDIYLGDRYTYFWGWTDNSRYFVTPQFLNIAKRNIIVAIIDVQKKGKAILEFEKPIFMKSVEDDFFTIGIPKWDRSDKRWTQEQSYRIDDITKWHDLNN